MKLPIKIKRIVALILTAACVVSLFSGIFLPGNEQTAAAAEDTDTTEDDFVIEDGVLTKYQGNNKVVKIPKGVKEIASDVFKKNKEIEKVIFPVTLRYIDSSAFEDCSNLQEVQMSYRLCQIGKNAFSRCTRLYEVDLSETQVEIIGQSAFEECTSLMDVILPDTIGIISENAFKQCTHLNSINFP